MARIIKQFQTISRHEASLRQSPATISCLVAVLDYIKTVLTDDGTQALFELVNQHINRKDEESHYLNLELMSEQIIEAIRCAFVALGLYTNDSAANQMYVDFFRDIYDGGERFDDTKFVQVPSIYDDGKVIPLGYNEFVKWLVSNPEIYVDEIPEDYDALKHGLTLRLAKEWFDKTHDEIVNAHTNTLYVKLEKLMTVCSVLPAYWITPQTFASSPYKLIGIDAYAQLMALVQARLLAMGSPLTIDFTTYPDTLELPLLVGYDETRLTTTSFFEDFYPLMDVNNGVTIVQFDLSSLEALYRGGLATFDFYHELLLDCGETDGRIFDRKWSDYYYPDHLKFVLSDSMTPEYKSTLTALRSNVNKNYTKMFHVHTVLKNNNFAIGVSLSIGHLLTERTLDIFNLVGLAKSVACVSLIPYRDVYDHQFNKLVIAFDNYNPEHTVTLIDEIEDGDIDIINFVISVSRASFDIHFVLDEVYQKISLPNTNRMFEVEPFFLYTGPRVGAYKQGTNRIMSLKLFGKTLSDEDSIATIAGFRQV